MSTTNPKSYARRATNSTDQTEIARYFRKAIEELARAIDALEAKLRRLD